jgi:hypothetical protein
LSSETIQGTSPRTGRGALISERLANRPLAAIGLAVIAFEALLALAGVRVGALIALSLTVAPGLALVPLLPAACRRLSVASVAVAPILGAAAISVGETTLGATGIAMTGLTVRLVPLAVAAAGLAAFSSGEPPLRLDRAQLVGCLGLVGALAVGVVLQERIIGGAPVPGNDWAKYLLYSDEIRRQGALLIDNPYWLLGVPFREDPGVPSLYGSYLIGAGGNAAVLMHGIWLFALMGIMSVYALARSLWGELAGFFAALGWAVVPVSQDILGWHGLANAAALAVMPLVLLYLAGLLRDGLERREAVGFGMLLVALAGFHRLSFAVGLATLGLCVFVGLALPHRRRVLAAVATAGVSAVVLGVGVAYALIDRSRTFGGTQGFEAYESQKVELELVARDLTYAFTAFAAVAVVVALVWVRRDRSVVPPLLFLLVIAGLAYSWVLEFPLAYIRMVYFLPVALMPLAGYALSRVPWTRAAIAAGIAATIAVLVPAWRQTENVRLFYTFASDTSVKGMDLVESRLAPGEVVVTDRCWSFLATWLLHTKTLAALEPADIQPKAEVPRAEQARQILADTPTGRTLARKLHVRYVVVNPECTDVDGRPLGTPTVGDPIFVSRRLVVLQRKG